MPARHAGRNAYIPNSGINRPPGTQTTRNGAEENPWTHPNIHTRHRLARSSCFTNATQTGILVSTYSSMHVNIPVSDRVVEAAVLLQDGLLLLQHQNLRAQHCKEFFEFFPAQMTRVAGFWWEAGGGGGGHGGELFTFCLAARIGGATIGVSRTRVREHRYYFCTYVYYRFLGSTENVQNHVEASIDLPHGAAASSSLTHSPHPHVKHFVHTHKHTYLRGRSPPT